MAAASVQETTSPASLKCVKKRIDLADGVHAAALESFAQMGKTDETDRARAFYNIMHHFDRLTMATVKNSMAFDKQRDGVVAEGAQAAPLVTTCAIHENEPVVSSNSGICAYCEKERTKRCLACNSYDGFPTNQHMCMSCHVKQPLLLDQICFSIERLGRAAVLKRSEPNHWISLQHKAESKDNYASIWDGRIEAARARRADIRDAVKHCICSIVRPGIPCRNCDMSFLDCWVCGAACYETKDANTSFICVHHPVLYLDM